jgi:hypothetical protein
MTIARKVTFKDWDSDGCMHVPEDTLEELGVDLLVRNQAFWLRCLMDRSDEDWRAMLGREFEGCRNR